MATAARGMASAGVGAAAAGASSGGGAGGGPTSIVFEKGAIQIDGAGKGALELTEEMFASVFERLAITQGLTVRT